MGVGKLSCKWMLTSSFMAEIEFAEKKLDDVEEMVRETAEV